MLLIKPGRIPLSDHCQSVSQSVVSQSVSQPASQPASQSVSQSVSQNEEKINFNKKEINN